MQESATNADPPNRPLVSVVIPTCNRREILQRCLEALAVQTYPNYEIIVVDDCSDDDTPAMLGEFERRHPDLAFRWMRNDAHAGANRSRNRGIRQANGEFVAFVDSDCIAQPDWLEKLMPGFCADRVAAVTGRVDDPQPSNVYELAFKGTHRIHGSGPAHRLVAGNLCVRRELLLEHMLDEDGAWRSKTTGAAADLSVSGGCDEEGLYLRLRAAGYDQLLAPDAVVLHEHPYTGRSFFRQAFGGGRSAARLVYKYHLPPRLDMVPFVLAYVTLPLIAVHRWAWVIPAFFLAGALAAITYNDLVRKGKTIGETLRSFPVLLAYYQVRLVGYLIEALRLHLGRHDLQRIRLGRPLNRR